MRWLERSVLLCLLMVVLTPAPAHAWFELLDYLSGPGRFYGQKLDFRVWCSGRAVPLSALTTMVQGAMTNSFSVRDEARAQASLGLWKEVVDQLKQMDQGLHLFEDRDFDDLKTRADALFYEPVGRKFLAGNGVDPASMFAFLRSIEVAMDRIYKASVSIGSTGIFISFCSPEKTRAFAVEVGFTTLQAESNPDYALDYTIRLNTFTGALSYRVPLPADRDVLDVGLIAGVYRFSSRGFDAFSGLTVEPFIDLHGPTSLVDAGGLKQLLGLVTVRVGFVWFPGGFDGEQFASAPSKPQRISGGEVTPSATIFFNLTPLLRRRAHTF